MKCHQKYFFILLAIFSYTSVEAQTDILSTSVSISYDPLLKTQKDYLDYLSRRYNVIFSYNANVLNDYDTINLQTRTGKLIDILKEIFDDEELIVIFSQPNKIILQSDKKKEKFFKISGVVVDQESGESIFGAVIREKSSGKSVLSNEKGYFVMEVGSGSISLETSYIAYKKNIINLNLLSNIKQNFYMTSDNLIDTIVIDDPKSRIQLIDGGHMIDVFKNKEYNSIIGERDLINNARILPGVQSGGEGQSGLFVRGGTPDQNLIMLEGVALYETSHVAGISSIFMEESIKEVSFVRNGFPARYGGRLSSVMDIQLKDGDKKKHNISITSGLAGAKIHLNGPISSEKTTYSLTARTSWLNFYVNNLLRKFTKYQDINIAYSDVLGKVTRNLGRAGSLSFMLYHGSDRLQLTKDNIYQDTSLTLHVFDRNALNWGNTVGSLKWNYLINDKLSLKLQSGLIRYNNGSRSSYIFDTTIKDSTYTDELDVISRSNISDFNVRADLDYYLSDNHVIRGGINYLNQRFNPTVKQSTVIIQGNPNNIVDKDSVIQSSQYQIYLEDSYKLNTKLFLYAGFHLGSFRQSEKIYHSLQPRFKVIWNPYKSHLISVAYSRMTQFVHLLSNSGLGLPSDLWVPSTNKIAPENANQFSMNYTYNLNNGIYINLGAYTKKTYNNIEYTSPVELFYFLINNDNIVPVYNTSRDWERNIFVGNTMSNGLEFLLHKPRGKTRYWTSLTWSKTEKSYPDINNGLPFPATHDKTWDINSGFIQKLNTSFSIGCNFVYNTGNTFSLATEEYDSVLGIKLLKANGRNNYRLPPFHQLSVNASYVRKSKNLETSIELNIYNVYNRFNAYFIYIYENPVTPSIRFPRKVSILPITPSLTATIKF